MASKRRFIVSDRCTRACACHPDNLSFSTDLLDWYSDGKSFTWMITESERMGRKLSMGGLSRHKKHLDYESDAVAGGGEAVDHLMVLQKMIMQGAKRVDSWRIGPSETLKAMDMYYRLTQGSAMQGLFNALSAAAAGEEVEEGSFDAGSLSPAELESVDADIT